MIQFIGKSLLALMIFGVILHLGIYIMVPVAAVLTAKVMTA